MFLGRGQRPSFFLWGPLDERGGAHSGGSKGATPLLYMQVNTTRDIGGILAMVAGLNPC